MFALAWVLVSAAPAAAQFDRGQISGTVKDAQGGVVPGATVTVTNTQTQITQNTVTDSSGFYTVPNLAPGRYDVSAELEGFKKAVRSGVQLDAASAQTIEFALATGALTESVTVTAEASALQTDTGLRKTIESKDIEQLSFSGRNPIGVVGLKPGVIGGNFNNYGFSDLGNGGFTINGSRSDENNITVDGATAIRTRSSGAIVGIQNVDAVQEVQVLTGDYLPSTAARAAARSASSPRAGRTVSVAMPASICATTSCRPIPGRETRALWRPTTPVPHRSTSSSMDTRLADPSRRTSCSSSARRSG